MMTLQWNLVAGFLYFEIILLLILLFPYISPNRWLNVFGSRILSSLGTQTQFFSYFSNYFALFALLLLLFVDAIRDIRKYSDEKYDLSMNPQAEMQAHMKLFRAQRNYYISGFALLLSLIIRRIVSLISEQGTLLMVQSEASSASLNQQTPNNANNGKVAKLQTEVNRLKEELACLKIDREAVKLEGSRVSKEYDRLMAELEKLEYKVGISVERDNKED